MPRNVPRESYKIKYHLLSIFVGHLIRENVPYENIWQCKSSRVPTTVTIVTPPFFLDYPLESPYIH